MEQKADQPVREADSAPSLLPAVAPERAPPALSGFVAAMGNQAFSAYVARAPRAVPAGRVLARQPPPGTDPADVTANERQDGLVQSLIALPIATASGNLESNPGKTMLHSIRRRVAAARGAFRSFHFPLESKPGQRMQDAQARIDVALALIDGMLSKHPDRLLRAHWGRTLSLCGSLSRHLPRPTAEEPEDKRALMRDSVCPAVAAAVADIPAIVAAETGEEMVHLMGNHDTVPEAIFRVAGAAGGARRGGVQEGDRAGQDARQARGGARGLHLLASPARGPGSVAAQRGHERGLRSRRAGRGAAAGSVRGARSGGARSRAEPQPAATAPAATAEPAVSRSSPRCARRRRRRAAARGRHAVNDAAAVRVAWAQARTTAAALAATDRLGDELTPVLEHGLIPQLDAALADIDDGLFGVAAESAATMLAVLDAMAGPLGIPPALRPVQEEIQRGHAALAQLPRGGGG